MNRVTSIKCMTFLIKESWYGQTFYGSIKLISRQDSKLTIDENTETIKRNEVIRSYLERIIEKSLSSGRFKIIDDRYQNQHLKFESGFIQILLFLSKIKITISAVVSNLYGKLKNSADISASCICKRPSQFFKWLVISTIVSFIFVLPNCYDRIKNRF